jgi:hypothetical protein
VSATNQKGVSSLDTCSSGPILAASRQPAVRLPQLYTTSTRCYHLIEP